MSLWTKRVTLINIHLSLHLIRNIFHHVSFSQFNFTTLWDHTMHIASFFTLYIGMAGFQGIYIIRNKLCCYVYFHLCLFLESNPA